jgi:hypothetical protein
MARKLTKEMHVLLSAEDHSELKAWAEQECRTLNAQLLYILRQALASRADGVAPLENSLAERISHATRIGLKGHA